MLEPIHTYIMCENGKFTVDEIYYYREYVAGKSKHTVESAIQFLLTFRFISIVEYELFGIPVYKVMK